MRTIFSLLFLCSAAAAQTVTSTTAVTPYNVSTCCSDDKCWNEIGYSCHSNPAERQMWFAGNASITNSPIPKCEDGWTLVADSAMQPKCAKELKDPIER